MVCACSYPTCCPLAAHTWILQGQQFAAIRDITYMSISDVFDVVPHSLHSALTDMPEELQYVCRAYTSRLSVYWSLARVFLFAALAKIL